MNATLQVALLCFKEGLRHRILYGIFVCAGLLMLFALLISGLFMRDILKEMLNKVDVGIALEDDVPDTKHSFTFENVPLAVALDVVCRSVDIGWRAEKQAEKWVIRVGKKYARRRAFLRPSGRANAFFGDAGATPFSGMAPADWERFGIEMGQWGEGLAESILKEVTPGDAEENATSLVLEENPVP